MIWFNELLLLPNGLEVQQGTMKKLNLKKDQWYGIAIKIQHIIKYLVVQ